MLSSLRARSRERLYKAGMHVNRYLFRQGIISASSSFLPSLHFDGLSTLMSFFFPTLCYLGNIEMKYTMDYSLYTMKKWAP